MNIHDATEQAYQNGYQKGNADAAREIFNEIDKITYKHLNDKEYSTGEMIYDLDNLKNKYRERLI